MESVGKGNVDLMTGLRNLVDNINEGEGCTITVIGNSEATSIHLKNNLPQATLIQEDASDSAYITSTGIVASVKRLLAEKLQTDLVII